MPQLLISVRSTTEAMIALQGGVDIIDIKEPARGSLGKPSNKVVQEIVAAVQSKVPVSVALGEWYQSPTQPKYEGITWAKVGLSQLRPEAWLHWLHVQQQLRPSRLLGVVYADCHRVHAPSFERMIEWIASIPACSPHRPGILIDTACKDGRGLLHWHPIKELKAYQRRCHQAGLFLALAGSLTMLDVKRLLGEVEPDIIAVRGLVCVGSDRQARVDSDRVRSLVQCLREGC